MKGTIVTSGQEFTDIDALACAVAYSELLILEGEESETILPGVLNASVTQTIKDWGIRYGTSPTLSDADYTVVDISDLEQIATCAREGNITEIFDHHTGFENYWEENIGENAHIEFIGACATLIWEEYEKRGQGGNISRLSGDLLSVGILSNTLNFGAQITDQRDRDAFQKLQKRHPLSAEWIERYFSDQEEDIRRDVATAVANDTKVITDLGLEYPLVIGQLELWDGSDFLEKNIGSIRRTLEKFGSECWLMNIPSLKDKRNTLYTESPEVKKLLSGILDIAFEGNRGATEKLWLRKEILRELRSLE